MGDSARIPAAIIGFCYFISLSHLPARFLQNTCNFFLLHNYPLQKCSRAPLKLPHHGKGNFKHSARHLNFATWDTPRSLLVQVPILLMLFLYQNSLSPQPFTSLLPPNTTQLSPTKIILVFHTAGLSPEGRCHLFLCSLAPRDSFLCCSIQNTMDRPAIWPKAFIYSCRLLIPWLLRNMIQLV